MVAVGNKDGNAMRLKPFAGIAQGKLGPETVIFLIVDITGKHHKIGPFPFAEPHKPFQGGKGCLPELPPGTGYVFELAYSALKGDIKMQIGGMDVTDGIHDQRPAWARFFRHSSASCRKSALSAFSFSPLRI